MKKQKIHYKMFKICLLILLFTLEVPLAYSQENKIGCIQGIWKGTSMDIEPYADLSTFFEIVQGDSICSFYLTEERIIISKFKFVNFDIQKEGIDFYNIPHKNILSINNQHDNDYLYTEIDQEGNISVDEFFICGQHYLTKLHFEFENQSFIPYTAYYYIKEQSKKDNRNYIEEFDILSKLKKARVKVEKLYFHNNQDEITKRKSFVVKGDLVIIEQIESDWIKVVYEGKKVTTEGWLKKEDVELLD